MEGQPEDGPVWDALHTNEHIGQEHTRSENVEEAKAEAHRARAEGEELPPGMTQLMKSLGVDQAELSATAERRILSILFGGGLQLLRERFGDDLKINPKSIQTIVSTNKLFFVDAFLAGIRYQMEREDEE